MHKTSKSGNKRESDKTSPIAPQLVKKEKKKKGKKAKAPLESAGEPGDGDSDTAKKEQKRGNGSE